MFEIRALTSLRLFAALAMVFSHVAAVSSFPFEWMNRVPLSQGVSFFFVLSGFILSVTYDKADLKRHSGSFYWARFSRIYPLYLTSLMLAVVIRLVVLPHTGLTLQIVASSLLGEGLMVQSWFPRGLWPLNGVDWSVSTEVFFYAIFPLVKRSRIAFALVAMAAASALIGCFVIGAWYGLTSGTDVGSFYRILSPNPLVRSVEFLLGVWLGSRFARRSTALGDRRSGVIVWSVFEIAALLACYVLSAYDFRAWVHPALDGSYEGAWKTLLLCSGGAPAFGAMIWVFAFERGIVSRCLRWHVLVFLGAASYSLYLFHELLFELLMHLNALPLYGAVPASQSAIVTTGLFCVLLGSASAGYLFIERPMRNWLRALRRGRESGLLAGRLIAERAL